MGKVLLSAVIAGLIFAGMSLLAVAQEATTIGDIGELTWLIIGVGAVLVVLKDIKTYLAPPPPTLPPAVRR